MDAGSCPYERLARPEHRRPVECASSTRCAVRAAALEARRGTRRFKILLRGNEAEIGRSQQLARELGLENLVYIRYEPDPRGYLSVIDVGFLLSESIEAISFAARELMAMGKPLISSNYAGLVENVDDRLNGRLIECGDAEGVAEAIGWFLDLDAAALAEVSRNARLKAERVFSVENQVRELQIGRASCRERGEI